VVGRAARRAPAAPPGDHLRDQPPVRRRDPLAVRGRRGARGAHVDHRRGRRARRAHGAPGHGRQPHGQRRRRAPFPSAHRDGAARLLRAVAREVCERHQRRHAAPVPGGQQPAARNAHHQPDWRRLAEGPRPASRPRAAGGRRGVPPAVARGEADRQARARKDHRGANGRQRGSGGSLRRPGEAPARVQAPAPERAAHPVALSAPQARSRSRHPVARLRLRRQGCARLLHGETHHQAHQRDGRRGERRPRRARPADDRVSSPTST